MNTEINLFSPYQLGDLELPNRIVMAPLTRQRAAAGNVPHQLNATYYAQRATAGLIISEATQISPQGLGYPDTPGIYSSAQVAGWRLVTDAVHQQGGRIFLQLWHVGRISHPDLQPDGALPVAPSAIAPKGQALTYQGYKPFVTPRALETSEIPGIVEQYRQGAANALAAGFDGVEIHAANGYLIDQFLRDGTNQRTDKYGGAIENRTRLLLEVTEAVTGVWDSQRVGVRLAPSGTFNDMHDSHPLETFGYAAQALNQFDLAYLHIVEGLEGDIRHGATLVPTSHLRQKFTGGLIVCGGYTRERGDAVLANKAADLVAFGIPYIANPDLPQRFALNAPLNQPNQTTFYGGNGRGEEGYTDYPFWSVTSEPVVSQ
ncbi:NADH:flavin oxidoreductase [Cylindrospermum stagnale PCC 7417]|uniref:NADH:flavin oxidoreductase n=1 Tax=Cylindrospermum stagnale PCC 7417 TaxID=56107 RepID=K9WXY4_9NOST|nr:alkene reductase [Cylindrospermum stagnale]AFZ24679.1 NADH:flavin oxidoreductase [Cylindrospermum stagnale PCC 7417]